MNHRQILEKGIEILKKAGIFEAENDARILFESAFEMNRTKYLAYSMDEADEIKTKLFFEKIDRRAQREPLQYIDGVAYFMGLEFNVTKDVLIPRFDTEVLVDAALKIIPPNSRVLDMCTGSGCIAISIAKLGQNEAVGVDISEAALKVAISNKEKNSVEGVSFIHSDMFSQINGEFDFILSNPPYIKTEEIKGLEIEVKDCEPMLALDGHDDGLFFYRILVKEGLNHLKLGGALIMEIGYDQAEDVSKLLRDNNYKDIKVIKDLAGLDRVALGWRK